MVDASIVSLNTTAMPVLMLMGTFNEPLAGIVEVTWGVVDDVVVFEGSDPLLGHAVINNAIVIAATDKIDGFIITFVPEFFSRKALLMDFRKISRECFHINSYAMSSAMIF